VTHGAGSVSFDVTSAWDTIRAVRVLDQDGGAVSVENLRTVDVVMGGSANSTVEVLDAKRGRITTADGNDTIVVRGFWSDTDARAGQNRFTINTGAGDDTITVTSSTGATNAVIDAGSGRDTVRGSSAADVILGGRGNDTMWGGLGRDIFDFRRGDGQDVIMDFDAVGQDRIRFEAGITSAMVNWQAVADGILVNYGAGDTVLLQGVRLADLALNDFLFS
jgi:Ca2+-binding RTX toxin-like protein